MRCTKEVVITATTHLHKHGIYYINHPAFKEFFRSPNFNSCLASLTCHCFCLGVTSLLEATVATQGTVREQSETMAVDFSVSPNAFSVVALLFHEPREV